jgi:AcrR family transcriptional regulator
MPIPATPGIAPGGGPPERPEWTRLTAQDKRERLIQAAITVFSERGLEAPMHEVATAAGAGVASIYRVFPSKHDLWAAIVVRRLDEVTSEFEAAEQRPGDRWTAFVTLLEDRVRKQAPEPFTIEARAATEGREAVIAAVQRLNAVQARVLEATRAEGRLRADATVEDLRLLFAATRAARRQQAGSARMLELLIDALDTRRGQPGG